MPHIPDLAYYSGFGQSTTYRLIGTYRQTGLSSIHVRGPLGRPHKLNIAHVNVSLTLIPVPKRSKLTWSQYLEAMVQDQPDISLEELQNSLLTTFGIQVSISTIHRELTQRGYNCKQAAIAALEKNEEA
jgi:transposase